MPVRFAWRSISLDVTCWNPFSRNMFQVIKIKLQSPTGTTTFIHQHITESSAPQRFSSLLRIEEGQRLGACAGNGHRQAALLLERTGAS